MAGEETEPLGDVRRAAPLGGTVASLGVLAASSPDFEFCTLATERLELGGARGLDSDRVTGGGGGGGLAGASGVLGEVSVCTGDRASCSGSRCVRLWISRPCR